MKEKLKQIGIKILNLWLSGFGSLLIFCFAGAGCVFVGLVLLVMFVASWHVLNVHPIETISIVIAVLFLPPIIGAAEKWITTMRDKTK